MSDSIGLTIISFLAPTGFFLHFYIANSTVRLGGQIVSGVMEGAPMPTAARRALLFQVWVPCMSLGVAHTAVMALCCYTIANLVGNPQVKLLGYIVGFVPAVGSLWYLVNTVVGARNYERFLKRRERQAEAD